MWNKLSIEEKLEAVLEKKFGKDLGGEYFSQYVEARNYLVNEVLPEIKGAEPSLSDHSAVHIANVLNNCEYVLEDKIDELSAIELYCLCLIVIFHDVGNIEGRVNHNKKIAEIYNKVRNNKPKFNHERSLVIQAAQAHCGKAKDGGKDTLKDVDQLTNLDGHPVRLRDLACILRLADELAEGPQRTSDFMCSTGKYDPKSQIFHNYANITNVFIDRGNERIALTYNINYIKGGDEKEVTELLKFTYHRAIKLDEERRYTKHYSDFLAPFKKTEIKINFSIDGIPSEYDLPKIELKDRFPVPGEKDPDIDAFMKDNSDYQPSNILLNFNKE